MQGQRVGPGDRCAEHQEDRGQGRRDPHRGPPSSLSSRPPVRSALSSTRTSLTFWSSTVESSLTTVSFSSLRAFVFDSVALTCREMERTMTAIAPRNATTPPSDPRTAKIMRFCPYVLGDISSNENDRTVNVLAPQ